jgi:hypothetical protein
MRLYIATPINGRSIEEIQARIAECTAILTENDVKYYNPFSEELASASLVDGVVQDLRPIEMLCDSAKNLEDCDGLVFIGNEDDLNQSRGCSIEIAIATTYDKLVLAFDNGRFGKLSEFQTNRALARKDNK